MEKKKLILKIETILLLILTIITIPTIVYVSTNTTLDLNTLIKYTLFLVGVFCISFGFNKLNKKLFSKEY